MRPTTPEKGIANHKIKRLTVEIDIDSKHQANQVFDRFSKLCRNQLRQKLDEQFSKISPDTEHWVIDKLELDLGDVTEQVDSAKILRTIPETLHREMTRAMQNGQVTRISLSANEQQSTESERTLEVTDLRENIQLPQVQTAQRRDKDALMYFLETGFLPWWYRDNSADELQRLLSLFEPDDSDALAKLFQQKPAILTRISYQAGAMAQARILDILESLGFELGVMRFVNCAHQLMEQQGRVQASSLTSVAPFIEVAWQRFVELLNYNPSVDVGFVALLERWNRLSEFEAFKLRLLGLFSNREGLGELAPYYPFINQLRRMSKEQNITLPKYIHGEVNQAIIPGDSTSDCWSDCWQVTNAGLVLLLDGLSELFKTLALTDQEVFVSTNAQQKAIHLLAYLSGETLQSTDQGIAEPQLLLNKILCGMQPSEPVWSVCWLSEYEKSAAQKLISDVIKRLEPNGELSCETFIEQFVQRPGMVEVKDQQWQLRIEPEGRDILLHQHFPSYCTVQYPWMPVPLTVVWHEHTNSQYQC